MCRLCGCRCLCNSMHRYMRKPYHNAARFCRLCLLVTRASRSFTGLSGWCSKAIHSACLMHHDAQMLLMATQPLCFHFSSLTGNCTCCRAPRQHIGNRHSGQTPTETPRISWTPSSTSVSCRSYGGPGGPSMQVSVSCCMHHAQRLAVMLH